MKETIETFNSEIYTLSKYLEDKDMELIHGERFRKMIKAMSYAIQALQAQQEALEALGEKNEHTEGENPYPLSSHYEDKGYNQCHDIASKIIAKKNLHIKDLGDEILALKGVE